MEDGEPDEARAEQTSPVGQSEPQVSRTEEEDMGGISISRIHIACAQPALLLYDKTNNAAKNELLVCKLSSVVVSDKYRARSQENGYARDHGSWGRIPSLPYVDLEFATTSLRSTEGFFHTMRNSSPRPDGPSASSTASLRRILSEKSSGGILSAFSEKAPRRLLLVAGI